MLSRWAQLGLLAFGLLAIAVLPGQPRAQDAPKTTPDDTTPEGRVAALKEQLAAETMHSTRKDLLELRGKIRRLELEIVLLKRREQKAGPPNLLEAQVKAEFEKDRLLIRLQDQVAAAEAEVEVVKKRSKAGEDDPTVRGYRRQLRDLDEQISARQKLLRPQIETELRERQGTEAKQAVVTAEEELAVLREHEGLLNRELENQAKTARSGKGDSDTVGLRLARLEDEVRQLRQVIEELKDLVKRK